tara:strand:+ start:3620 stop:4138 length:519 start_codon:yes stop_codon:yes gene_type:complete
MNIFAIERNECGEIDWEASAVSQDNYRVVKMILESCQMLSTALNELSGRQIARYRSTHKNHPSTKWVCESSANYMLLVRHTRALLREYTERFGKTHKCEGVLRELIIDFNPGLFPYHEPTTLPLCMPEKFKSDDIVESYRKFYASKPKIRYPLNKVPSWFVQYRGDKEYQLI